MAILSSIIGGGISLIGSTIASNKSASGTAAAQQKYVETTTEVAGNQLEWDKELAGERHVNAVKASDIEYGANLDALEQQGASLDRLRSYTAQSFGQELEYTKDIAASRVEATVERVREDTKLTTDLAVESYFARRDALEKQLSGLRRTSEIRARGITLDVENQKSDRARQADAEAATMAVAAGESGIGAGVAGRLQNEIEFMRGLDITRLEEGAELQFEALEADLQIAAVNASSDLQIMENDMRATLRGAEIGVNQAGRELSIFQKETAAELESLQTQMVFELDALDIEGQGLNDRAGRLREQYDFNSDLMDQELARSNEMAQFVHDQTILSAEGQADANTTLALANRDSTVMMAGASVFSNITKTGFNALGSYYGNKARGASTQGLLSLD